MPRSRGSGSTWAEDLVAGFAAEFGFTVTDEHRFGSPSLGLLGVSDGAAGVQWNTWVHRKENAAYLGVNLEGKKYDGWPIARFIEREFRHPRLFDIIRQLAAPDSIQMIFHRDAWQVSARPPIEERQIGLSGRLLTDIDPEGWKRTLQEAYECLDPERSHRHRALQMVTTKNGRRVELPVSPHLQFRRRISDAAEGKREWAKALREGKEALQPLYEYVTEQASA